MTEQTGSFTASIMAVLSTKEDPLELVEHIVEAPTIDHEGIAPGIHKMISLYSPLKYKMEMVMHASAGQAVEHTVTGERTQSEPFTVLVFGAKMHTGEVTGCTYKAVEDGSGLKFQEVENATLRGEWRFPVTLEEGRRGEGVHNQLLEDVFREYQVEASMATIF